MKNLHADELPLLALELRTMKCMINVQISGKYLSAQFFLYISTILMFSPDKHWAQNFDNYHRLQCFLKSSRDVESTHLPHLPLITTPPTTHPKMIVMPKRTSRTDRLLVVQKPPVIRHCHKQPVHFAPKFH